MKLKYYLKGFGIGVIFATLVLSISFYSRMGDSKQISKQEVERLATAYGMSYPEETTDGENLSQGDDSVTQETDHVVATNEEIETRTDQELENSESGTNKERETNLESGTNETVEEDQESEVSGEIETHIQSTTDEEIERNHKTGREVETNYRMGIQDETKTAKEQEESEKLNGKWEVRTVENGNSVKETTITVAFGMYASTIAELLEETGVIEDAQEFSSYLIKKGCTRRLQAGVYTFTEGMDFEEIAGKLLWETD